MKPNIEKEAALSAKELRSRLNYDKETGAFIWITCRDARYVGKVAGSKHPSGYVLIELNGFRYFAHRLAFLWMTGEFPNGEVDHINRNKRDNRFSNLRIVSRNENAQNMHIANRSKTGYQGVSEEKCANGVTRYKAEITHNNKKIYVGRYATAEDAHAAYLIEKQRLHTADSAVSDMEIIAPKKDDPKEKLIGKRFGRLTVVRFDRTEKQRHYWLVRCDCGIELTTYSASLTTGNTKSCGCYAKDRRLEGNKLRRERERSAANV